MDYTLLYQLSNILQSNNYRKLLTEFNKLINESIPFSDATIYLFNNQTDSVNELYQVKTYRYIKGRLYDDEISFDNFSNTIIEDLYLSKEIIILDSSRLYEYKDFFKNVYYDELNYTQVISIPLIDGIQVYGGIEFKFKSEYEEDIELLELACEMLNAKLITLKINKENLSKLDTLSIIIDKENIFAYSIKNLVYKEEMNLIIKGNHKLLINSEKKTRIFSLTEKTYKQVVLDKDSGYVVDISNEVNNHLKVLRDTYYDSEKKLYNKNKLLEEMRINKTFSLIKIIYDSTYFLDVKKIVLDFFDMISIVDGDIVILTKITDKRVLKKTVSELETKLGTIITLDYSLGVIAYPKDLKNKDLLLDILESITCSNEIFYDKLVHFQKENDLIKKINIINAIKEKNIEINYYPIINLEEKLVAYYVKTNNYEIDDKRLELKLLKVILQRLNEKNGNYEFIIDISNKLAANYDMINFLEEANLNKKLISRLCFSLSSNDKSLIEYLNKKRYKIAFRGEVEIYFRENLKTDYFITHIEYDDSSNPYIDMLSRMEGLGITKPIFITKKIEDFNYLVMNQVGYIMTEKYKDEAML